MREGHDRLHTYFGLSYANYLVVPRSILQSMPDEWQGKMASLLEEMRDTLLDQKIDWPAEGLKCDVLLTRLEKYVTPRVHDDLADYQRGRRRLWK